MIYKTSNNFQSENNHLWDVTLLSLTQNIPQLPQFHSWIRTRHQDISDSYTFTGVDHLCLFPLPSSLTNKQLVTFWSMLLMVNWLPNLMECLHKIQFLTMRPPSQHILCRRISCCWERWFLIEPCSLRLYNECITLDAGYHQWLIRRWSVWVRHICELDALS